MNYKDEILNICRIGDYIRPHLQIKSIGYKYVVCISLMEYIHEVKYTLKEFYEAYC